MQSNTSYQSLLEMGCNPIICQAAIKVLKTEDLSALLDWISDHTEQQQKWSQWLKDNQQNKSQGHSIQQLIKKQLRDQLMTKGHSKNVAEKSLLFTNNQSIQSAQKWIQQHKTDADFEQQLRIQGQQQSKVKLSPEEAKAKLQQLTKKARQMRIKRQQQDARQRQKNRVRYAKQMLQAKRIQEELGMKRQVQLDKIQKQKDQQYKRKLVQQMRRQRNQKLGIKQEVTGQTNTVNTKKQAPKLSLMEQVQLQCEQVKVGNHAYPDLAKTFFETAQIYVNNIIKNNGQEKFRKINKQNKAFQNRICQAFGGLQMLNVLGYQEQDNSLVMKQFNLSDLKKVSDILQRYKNFY